MQNSRKICVVTGSRAEYGLLYWLMKEIEVANDLELQIIATGMHLSPEFGLTYLKIEEDGFVIDQKVEILLSSDTPVGISKSMGLGMIGFAEALSNLRPDLIVVLGDRFEIFSVVSAALIAKMPVAHLHGGEVTQGVFDEAIRHSVTKMSHLHFTATESYRDRVIQMGECSEKVFNVGALGVENIKRLKLLSKETFEESINFKLGKRNLLVTFHPVTLEDLTARQQFSNLLQALNELEETHLIFTKTNADTDGRIINRMIDDYATAYPKKVMAFTNLGQLRYLSAMKFVDGVIGNSSSGIIEAPSLGIGTVNIGNRQAGRVKADSVIDCDPSIDSVRKAISELYKVECIEKSKMKVNPYDKVGTAINIVNIIRENIGMLSVVKKFCDISPRY